jgi:hypothetical protein
MNGNDNIMNSIWSCTICVFGFFLIIPTPMLADAGRDGWTIVTLSDHRFEDVTVDSLCRDSLFIRNLGDDLCIPLDSIGLMTHRPGVEFSTRSYIISACFGAFGAGVFLGNTPKQPDPSVWSGVIYGLEFGGAILVGAIVGAGVGYIIDRSGTSPEVFDLTGSARLHSIRLIKEKLARNR